MSLAEVLRDSTRVFLDTSPVIYYFESHPTYGPLLDPIFDRLDHGSLTAVTSPVTLAEVLIQPLRDQSGELCRFYRSLVKEGRGIEFVPTGAAIAEAAARLRADHGLKLMDAIQLATAAHTRCELFLTNDAQLKRVPRPRVVVLKDAM